MLPMPAGGTPVGLLYFAATKFAGYTAFCRWGIQPQIDHAISEGTISPSAEMPSAWLAGGVRTLIGVTIGAAVGLAFWRVPYFANHDLMDNGLFFGLLIPVRIFEWWLLLHWIYKATLPGRSTSIKLIVVGILVSFALDVAGVMAAFVMPGGIWVC
jgi:hypothetical protein